MTQKNNKNENKTKKNNNNENTLIFKKTRYTKVRILGKGHYGTTYLLKHKNKQYAFKIQKILESERENDNQNYIWREIDFNNNFIAKLNVDDKYFFMEIYDYEITNNCNHKQFTITNNSDEYNIELDKSDYCIYYLMELINGLTVNDFIYYNLKLNYKISSKLLINLGLQFIKSIQLLSSYGYSHNDIHFDNMMLTKIPRNCKSFNLNNNKIKKYKYQFKLIDYGLMNHKKFKQYNDMDNYLFLDKPEHYYYKICLFNLLDLLLLYHIEYIYIVLNKSKPSYDYDEKVYLYQNIMNNHPEFFTKSLKKYTSQYPETKTYIAKVNQYIKETKFTDIALNSFLSDLFNSVKEKKKYIYGLINIVIKKIIINFIIEYLKDYLKYCKLEIIDDRLLKFPVDKEISLRLLEFTKVDEIIGYLVKL